MMLVEHNLQTHFVRCTPHVQVHVVQVGSYNWIEKLVGQVDPNRRALEGAPVRIRWSKYRGEGKAVFSELRPETDETTGETSTTVTFSAPGVYILRAQANDSSGASGGFQCCWTNAHVQVDVSP